MLLSLVTERSTSCIGFLCVFHVKVEISRDKFIYLFYGAYLHFHVIFRGFDCLSEDVDYSVLPYGFYVFFVFGGPNVQGFI